MNRGLLVGINQYPGAPLNGCVNDVTDAAEFLVASCGFQENDLRIITDDRATTDAIKERLRWLIEGAAAGDRLYFHYSGHGTQMAIRNADGGVTSNHDAICPVDFDWSEEHAITDDDFREIFSGVPSEVEFNWVSDSCHSGDLARVMAARRAQGRSYPMNPDMAWRLRTARTLRLKPAGFFRAIEHLNGALISGCRSDQTSADAYIDGRYNGALTYYLLKVLKGSDGLTMPLNALVPQVNSTLATNGYDQEPQLRGNPDILAQSFLAWT